MPLANRKICILGTHHAYQYTTVRKKYWRYVSELIELHAVDLVAEEFSKPDRTSYAAKIAAIHHVLWRNVDLTTEERKFVPDINAWSIGTQIDFELHSLREWVWVTRTASVMKQSALLICGLAHSTGVAYKFEAVGFDVETHVYFDNADDELIATRAEPDVDTSGPTGAKTGS
jgi:hypothetical protein